MDFTESERRDLDALSSQFNILVLIVSIFPYIFFIFNNRSPI